MIYGQRHSKCQYTGVVETSYSHQEAHPPEAVFALGWGGCAKTQLVSVTGNGRQGREESRVTTLILAALGKDWIGERRWSGALGIFSLRKDELEELISSPGL